jgi:superfamily II DNA helicase RecQ
MKSEYAVFNISVGIAEAETSALNQFIRQNRIVQVSKELVRVSDAAFWTFLVEYLPGTKEPGGSLNKPGVDYRDLLSAQDFVWFMKLKDVRTTLAEKAGIPVYAVFTNEQLAEIVRQKPKSLAKLQEIKGIGESKAKSYGQACLDCLSALDGHDETKREPD